MRKLSAMYEQTDNPFCSRTFFEVRQKKKKKKRSCENVALLKSFIRNFTI